MITFMIYNILFVGYTYRDDDNIEVIRIISARRATSKERRYYEHGQTY